MRIRAQLRLGIGNRRKSNTEERNSVEKGTHRRKALAPVKVCFAGAGESVKSVPPASLRSPEERARIRDQLRLGAGNRRTSGHRHPSSDDKGPRRSWAAPAGRDCEFVQNFFNISVTFPFTNYTYRGIIISR